MAFFRRWYRRFIASLRLDLQVVCEESRGERDYHYYHDTKDKYPDHFVPLTCERCGKEFWL